MRNRSNYAFTKVFVCASYWFQIVIPSWHCDTKTVLCFWGEFLISWHKIDADRMVVSTVQYILHYVRVCVLMQIIRASPLLHITIIQIMRILLRFRGRTKLLISTIISIMAFCVVCNWTSSKSIRRCTPSSCRYNCGPPTEVQHRSVPSHLKVADSNKARGNSPGEQSEDTVTINRAVLH